MKIFLFLIIASSLLAQDDSISKLFPGKWKMVSEKNDYYEEWKIANDNELTGIGYSIQKGDSIVSERLYLKKFADIWAYVAFPVNQPITLFALAEFSQNKFTFENGEHDFPQRIIYEFTPDGNIHAVVEGTIDGELMKREFSFIRIKK